jgi:hypothetical protein
MIVPTVDHLYHVEITMDIQESGADSLLPHRVYERHICQVLARPASKMEPLKG